MRAAFITDDKYLFGKAALELSGRVILTSELTAECEILFYDCESSLPLPDFSGRVVMLSRKGADGALKLPLPLGAFLELVSGADATRRLKISEEKRGAILDGRYIPLTAHEYSLLSRLLESPRGISRLKLSEDVFGERNDRLLNLYVHYLREKLEGEGERIIISERGSGYSISKKFIGGES